MLNKLEQQESKLSFPLRKILFNSKAFQWSGEFSFVFGLTLLGMILSLQGWKSFIPAFDMLTYFDNAYNLLHHAIFPQYGDISSYGSFSPPGTSWLMALGVLIFKDPRLYEKVGSALLHFGTLCGIFILTKKLFGRWSAYFTTLLYGLSGIGLDYAGSLWPIGHPFFYVWMVYFAFLWAQNKAVKYLTLAGVTWAIGMYVDMAIAPSFFILPAIWLFFRPPIFSKSLLFGFVVSLFVWYPYLKFEAGRNFLDLQSQLGRQSIFPANYRISWCDPHLVLAQSDKPSTEPIVITNTMGPSQSTSPTWLSYFFSLEKRVALGLLSNFNQVTSIPQGNIILLFVGSVSLLFLGVGDSFGRINKQVSEFLPTRAISKKIYQKLTPGITSQNRNNQIDGARLLALSLAIPWLILIVVAEPGRSERFTWLWPLQLLVAGLFATYALPQWRAPKIVTYTTQFLVLLLILPFASLPTRFESWSNYGWAGQDAAEKQVTDYIAHQITTEGKEQASIGYQTFIYPFMANYNVINPRYKVGAEFDLLFKYQYGIINTTQCAEGFSSRDEYRIVETIPKNPSWAPRDHFDASLDDDYKVLARFGTYEVFKRQ